MDGWRHRFFSMDEISRTAYQLWAALFLLLVLMSLAVIFYFNIESGLSGADWTLPDSIYLVVMLVTTIGLREVHPLSQIGEIFTSVFAILSLATLALAVRSAARLLVVEQLSQHFHERRRLKLLKEIRDHYIVCGYGRMGRQAVHQLQRRGYPVVVVEQNPEAVEQLRGTKIAFVEGNASDDRVLREARIDLARGLIAASDSDEDNVFIVLSARLLNPTLYIVARAAQETSVDKMHRAGANSVHSPYVVGGNQLATAAVAPGVLDFLELVLHHEDPDIEIAAVEVPLNSPVVGKPMLDSGVMQEEGAIILGRLDAAGKIHSNPRPDTIIKGGDQIIAMGSRAQIEKLQKVVRP